ncbi:Glycosyltransferase [Rhynchospora pubera]|uniref:Glycosyltransferase n=1 Tax=Rhynchospora pubera TaxID=906938 RepID=A0AAV8GTV0_9POAL|nr:Glycosyltransferase [Rhynchospora pubera]
METQSSPLHIVLFPILAHGHLLPMADVARLFALHGVKCTILTTPGNVTYIETTIEQTNEYLKSKNEPGLLPISISLIPFPSAEVGLPDGIENVSISSAFEIRHKFFHAFLLLEKPFEQKLKEINPDAFVSDTFYAWSADVSARTSIPRLVFNGMGLLARCGLDVVHEILESLPDDVDKFVVPGLPHQFEMHRSQHLFYLKNKQIISALKHNNEMDARSYGEIVNSFLELEVDYAVHWRDVVRRKAWLVGPVALCNEKGIEKSSRGGASTSIGTQELLHWLDSKRAGTVVYICFGSIGNLNISKEQTMKIAIALEESNRDFIWVVKSSNETCYADWLDEFERRMHKDGIGLIIRGWAPQVVILNHPAVGGFLTQCGWNSILEAITAGVPMITWPMNGDQFFNEMLVVDVLQVGAAVGAKVGGPYFENQQLIEAEAIKSVIERVVGEGMEGDAMRKRAGILKEKAKAAVQEGGSSYSDLKSLIEELKARRL